MSRTSSSPYRRLEDPAPPRESAQDSLQYIRRTLDAASRLSSVSGIGLVAVGAMALAAVVVNVQITGAPWSAAYPYRALTVWAALLLVSSAVTAGSMAAKSRRTGQLFWSPVLRKALAICAAPMLLGLLLSVAVLKRGELDLLPLLWLGCYGAALTSAGVISVSPVRWMGISFLLLATLAVFAPVSSGLALLALGFGGLHLLFGGYIYWRHDG
jgi:hypothetical protein